MPRYLLRFKVETCLACEHDLTVDFLGHRPSLLFSRKTAEEKYVIAQVEVEALDNRQAWGTAASSLLPPILDALSFATGTPLLLRDCELVLKSEAGSSTRRALYVGHRHVPSLAQLRAIEIEEMKKILADGEELKLPLSWHRYALDRQLVLEQFIFNWLAFEALAGDADVPTRCPTCHEEVKHCNRAISHRGSSKIAARQIFCAAHPETTDQEFNNEIWNKSRNYVFHGRRYPEPKHLLGLLKHSQEIHAAVDRHIDEILGLGNRLRPHRGYETWNRRFIFVQWTTQNPSDQYTSDWPRARLEKMTEEEDANGPAHQTAAADGVTLLDYRESENW